MSGMVERVARAILLADMSAQASDKFLESAEGQWQLYEEHARAVIKAMRDLTDPMIKAASQEYIKAEDRNDKSSGLARLFPQDLPKIYYAIIDAALKE